VGLEKIMPVITIDLASESSIREALAIKITTPELLQAVLSEDQAGPFALAEYDQAEDAIILRPERYVADDGNAPVVYDDSSATDAAQDYVDNGDWGDRTDTCWIHVSTWRQGINADGDDVECDEVTHTVTIEADEPKCSASEHYWVSPHELLGGLEENPGVFGHGGGVIMKFVCLHCGTYSTTDTWAQDSQTGEQGLESVSYEPADERSREWVAEQAQDEDAA
jgi:hypothetical protein